MKDIKLKGARVLLLCTTDNMIWQFLLPHIRDLEEYGATVDCVCSRTGFWFSELQEKYGLNMIELPMKRKPINMTNWKAYKFLKKLQKQNKYDLIYCQQPTGGLLGRFIGKKYKLPVIYTAHGFFFFKGNNPIKNFIFKSAERYMARFTDVLITMNDEDFQACQKWKADKKYQIHGIGLDTQKYNNVETNDLTKEELGLQNNEKIILSVSEFIPRKNYKTMLYSVAELAKNRVDFKYLLCGTGEQFEEMKNLAKELKIEDRTLFLGYRKDIDKIMKISDIFFHQSYHEGLTMGIMEAMHFSLPCVVSDARGNVDLIDDGKGGIITKPEDINGQVEALNTLLNDEPLREKYGKFNKEKLKLYYLDSVRGELENIYRENNLFSI